MQNENKKAEESAKNQHYQTKYYDDLFKNKLTRKIKGCFTSSGCYLDIVHKLGIIEEVFSKHKITSLEKLNQLLESTKSSQNLNIPEPRQVIEPKKRKLNADIFLKGSMQVPAEKFPLLKKDHVHIFCGVDKITKEPFVGCTDNEVVKSFTWEFLIYFATQNGLLDNFKSSEKGGDDNETK